MMRSRAILAPALVALFSAGCTASVSGSSQASTSVPTRAPDATVTAENVRVEVWAPQRAVAAGEPLTATGRVTNQGMRPIWYVGRPCAQVLTGLVRFPAFDSYGRRHAGVAGEVKDRWARGDGSPSDRYTTLGSNAYFGVQDPAQGARCISDRDGPPPMTRLDPGRSVSLSVTGAAEWENGAFPQGEATLGMLFAFGTSQAPDATRRPVYTSVPVRISGGRPTITPGAALDAAFTARGVSAYLQAHAHDTQLTAVPRLSAAQWIVDIKAIDVSSGAKAVAPTLEVSIDRASGKVLALTTTR